MAEATVVAAVRTYLGALKEHGLAGCFGVVFGSHATGRTDKWSDIDLLVVSPDFDDGLSRSDVDHLWRLAARTDSRIEPVPCGERQWREDASSAIIEIARREGQRIGLVAEEDG